MSKYANPVRGYVPCPVCHSVSTVHQVGEGKLIAEGEPPKNGRNLGLLYYRCPSCGNSSMSKTVHKYIEQHQADSAEALQTMAERVDGVSPEIDHNPDGEFNAESTLELSVESVESTDLAQSPQTNQDKVASAESTDAPTPSNENKTWLKRGLIALGVLCFIIWLVRRLKPKVAANDDTLQDNPKDNVEVQHVAA